MLQLYILTKDRPEELRIALNSALNQDYKDIEIIVSDNSEDSTTLKMMHADFGDVHYIKRTPHLKSSMHTEAVIEEATADFVMLFHDDDILKNTHVSNILSKFKQNPDLAAVASNGTFIGDFLLKNREIIKTKNEILIKSAIQLLEYYLGLSNSSPAPFPGYIYRTSFLKKVYKNINYKCGKHSDIQILAEMLNFGHILWLPTPTLYYRIHAGQDSANESIYDRNKVLHFMSSHGIDLKSKSVIYYKFMYLSRWWKNRNNSTLRIPRGIKEKTVAKFLLCSLLYLSFSSKAFLKKIFKLILFLFLSRLGKFKH